MTGKSRTCRLMLLVLLVTSLTTGVTAAEGPLWAMYRSEASGSGASTAVGEALEVDRARLGGCIVQLLSDDRAAALTARLTLKRAGADAVPLLEDEIKRRGPAAEQCRQLLENLQKPEILWKMQADAFFTGSPAVDERAVYAADRDGVLYAVDRLTGDELWRTRLPALTNGSPVPKGDSLYIGTHDGSVLRVLKARGNVVWTFKADPKATVESWAFVWDSVAVDDGSVTFGTADGKVYAVSTEDGKKRWEFKADAETRDGKEEPPRFYGTPAVTAGKVYIGNLNRKFYCLDAADGRKVWEFTASDPIMRSPAVRGGLVFFVTTGHDLFALDRVTGARKWCFTSERKWLSHPTVYGEHVLAAGEYGRMYALEAETGKVYWGANAPAPIDGTLAVVNDRIYYNTTGMQLGCINFRSAGRIWSFTTPAGGSTKAPSPAVDDGIVYITTRQTLRTNNPYEMSISKCILAVAEPSDNVYGLNPMPVHWGLEEVHRRVPARHRKPYHLLKDEVGYFQPETLIFNDPQTGSEIVRFSDDQSAIYHQSKINRPSYNANGAYLVMHSARPYYPGRYILRADGSRFRRIDLDPFILNYGIMPCWDRKRPNIVYTEDNRALYTVDVETFRTTRVCDLPDPDRPKDIFSYPSPDNQYILLLSGPKVYLARTDGTGVTTIDLPSPRAKELAPKHDPTWEARGAHDIYFSLSPENTFIFNYGPTASSGEGIFYEMDTHGKLLRVVYPYNDPGDRETVYYSHPGWRQDGKKVAYFGYGGQTFREGRWAFFLRDRDGTNAVRLCDVGIGGHCGWDNFDDDWVFASPSVGRDRAGVGGTITRFKTDGSVTYHVLCDARPEAQVNASYSAIPRVAPSPDGTKAVFSSAMLGDATLIDMYSVVARRPDPPTDVTAAGMLLTWKPPRRGREVMGYNVYRSADTTSWERLTGEPIGTTRFIAPGDGLYAVTSVEWSGLESLAVSGTAAVGNVKPVFVLDAEFAEFSVPVKEIRDMTAANWFAVENTAFEEGAVRFTIRSQAGGRFRAHVRIRGGKWSVAMNDADCGEAGHTGKDWRWVALDKDATLRAGENTLVLKTDSQGAAVDKVILTADAALQPKDRMHLDDRAPDTPGALTARRLAGGLVQLDWTAPTDADLRHYHIYYSSTAAAVPVEQRCRIASPPKGESRYIDFAARPGVPAHYAVTAVDRHANESPPARASVAAPAGN